MQAADLNKTLIEGLTLSDSGQYVAAIEFWTNVILECENAAPLDDTAQAVLADIYFARGRACWRNLVYKRGLESMKVALWLYWRYCGLGDSRSQFCLGELKSCYVAVGEYDARTSLNFAAQYLLNCNTIRSLPSLSRLSDDEIFGLIEAHSETVRRRMVEVHYRDYQKEEPQILRDAKFAMGLKMYEAVGGESVATADGYCIFRVGAGDFLSDFLIHWPVYAQRFNAAVQSSPILVVEKCLRAKDGRVWLYFSKGATLEAGGREAKPDKRLFKVEINSVYSVVALFNSRLKKLKSRQSFYVLSKERDDATVCLLCDTAIKYAMGWLFGSIQEQ